VVNQISQLAAFFAVVAVAGTALGQAISPTVPTLEYLPAPAVAKMSLDDLEQLALERNPTLVQAGAQVRISRGEALQAGLPLNPEVGYVAEQIGAAGTAGELQGMFIEQEIVTGGKLRLSRAKYAQQARQAEIQVLAQRYRVLYSVRVAYYEALAQQQTLKLQQQTAQTSSEITTTVSELMNVGQANRTDMLQAEIAYQRASANRQMGERRLQSCWEQLAAIVGEPDLPFNHLEGQLEFAGEDSFNRDAALAHLLECSPELRFARAEVVRDQIALQRERVEPIPNVIVRADTGYNFESRDTVAGVEVGVRLPIFDKNQGTIMQAQAELQRAQAEVVRMYSAAIRTCVLTDDFQFPARKNDAPGGIQPMNSNTPVGVGLRRCQHPIAALCSGPYS